MAVSNIIKKISNFKTEVEDSKLLTKEIYNFSKSDEVIWSCPQSKNVLQRLHTEKMLAEQIWQQIELKNSTVISMSTDFQSIDGSNVLLNVGALTSKIDDEMNEDDGVETGEETDDENETVQIDRTSDFEEEDVSNEQENEEEEEVEEEEEEDDEEEEDEFDDIADNLSEFSDLDKDTYGDIAIGSDEDDDSDDDDDTKIEDSEEITNNNIPNKKNKKHFQSSTVDSKFFNLRESEWIADEDLIGKSFNNDEEEFDFMEDADAEQSDDEGNKAMYNAFFDVPPSDLPEHIQKSFEEEQVQESSEEEEIEDFSTEEQIEESFAEEQIQESFAEEQIEESSADKTVKSKFEASVAKETMLTKELEEETYLTEKPWIMKGEVQKKERPANSALEHHLEYNVAVRPKPIITEETTKNIEKIILSRIRAKCWDDVERKIKPTVDPFQFKQKLILDEEKSKKSLAAIYEEEFLRKQEEEQNGVQRTLGSVLAESDEKFEELPIHKEIKKEMDDLFLKLDALSNCHYTPRYRAPEIKVVSNLPAVTIEEATPTIVSDATLLAPQEIVAPLRGELKGDTEKDDTDRKRERRQKKKHQKQRAQREEQKLNKQLKKKDRDGFLNTEASVKFVEKAVKKGSINVLNNDQKSVKSSKNFFEQLENNISERTKKKRKREFDGEGKGKKKKNKPLTVAQLLL